MPANKAASPSVSKAVPAAPAKTVVVPAIVPAPVVAVIAVPRREEQYRWVRFLAEVLGTGIIAFVVAATNAQFAITAGSQGEIDFIAIIWGQVMVYAAMYAVFRHVSGGHFNPAVTFSYMILGEMNIFVGVAYILAQLFGAIPGALLAWGVFYTGNGIESGPRLDPLNICGQQANDICNSLGLQSGEGRMFLIELIGSTVVVFAFVFLEIGNMVGSTTWLAIAFAQGAFFFALKIFQNAFFNPAVALGAAVADEGYDWKDNWFWVTIIAPLLASIIAALIYGIFFQVEGHGKGPHLQFGSSHNKRYDWKQD